MTAEESDPTRVTSPPQPPSTRAEAGTVVSHPGDAPTVRTFDAGQFPAQIGPYRIIRMLGRGGMGAVYLGHDDSLDRSVAVKVMLPHEAQEDRARARFLREGQALARIKSDQVVTVYHVGEDRGIPYIGMEYLRGSPLDAVLRSSGPLPVDRVLRIARDVAAGLAAVHAAGLVHRDVKPANLWVENPGGRVKVLDFGIAHLTDRTRVTGGGVIGTPAYMAPEQARGHADVRSDLFSLGAVLFEMLAGRLPFQADTPIEILSKLATEDAPPVRQFRDEIPEQLTDLISRMLSRNPDDRPQTAVRVLAELGVLGDAGFAPYSPAPKPRQKPPPKRHGWWKEAVAAIGALGVLAGLIFVVKSTPVDLLDGESTSVPSETTTPTRFADRVEGRTPTDPGRNGLGAIPDGLGAFGPPPIFSVPPTSSGDTNSNPPEEADIERRRRETADWVLAIGGRVCVEKDGRSEWYGPRGSVPRGLVVHRVDLSGCKLPEDISRLAVLPRFEELNLSESTITDEAIKKLWAAKPLLSSVNLAKTSVTDKSVDLVTRMGFAKEIDLSDTKVTADGVRLLARAVFLHELRLDGLPIEDKDLTAIGRISFLHNLSIKRTKVTSDGVKALKTVLPKCLIQSDFQGKP